MEDCEECYTSINNSLEDGESVTRSAKFVGTFSVDVDILARKSQSIQNNLSVLRAGYNHGEDVLLSISLTKVTVTSVTSSLMIMSHSLKRISYATCDPASCLFSFMSRHPTSQYIQQCHTFRLATPSQAEELNTVVGTAFRMAYAAQLQSQKAHTERRPAVKRMMLYSRSAEDLLGSQNKMKSSKSTATLAEKSVTRNVTTCQEYSEVWESPDDRMSQVTGSDTCHVAGSDTRHVAGSDNMTRAVDTCHLDSVAQDSGISSTSDSTISYSTKNINLELEDLSKVPWYEAEMPRDLAMTVLANEPLGSFMVRRSETQPGTLALSVRVPKTFHPLGITHYIIVRVDNGYQIKGFLKVHSSLTALITHHSIMPELLPVTLNIHRHNPSFSDLDHDYASLQDFTQLMKDMKISGSSSNVAMSPAPMPQYDQLEEEDVYQ